ncbi:MAG: hypothetical protein WD059_08560 [Balneolaceae bacterium]
MTSYPKSKFIRAVWTFNAIAFAILLSIALLSEIPFNYLSSFFAEEDHERGLIVGSKAEKASKLNVDLQHLMYDTPTRIDSTDFFFTPVVVLDKDLPQSIKDDINSAADMSIYMVGAAINILFFNKDRSQVRKLLTNNGYIDEYSIGIGNYDYNTRNNKHLPFAIYKIALNDDNGDSRINEEDNAPYYLSDLDGTNLRQITPDSLDLSRAWFSDNYTEIYFDEVIEDKSSPLTYKNYYEKTRIVYYYSLLSEEFRRFDELQEEFIEIQKAFNNSAR